MIDEADFVDLVEDNLSGAAVLIGYLQGVLPASMVGHEGLMKMDEFEIFSEDPHESMTNLMGYFSTNLGNDALLSILASLIGVGILKIDADTFHKHHTVDDSSINNNLN